jgi:hypothetical protein
LTVADGTSDIFALSFGNNHFINIESSSILFEYGPDNGSGGPFDENFTVI